MGPIDFPESENGVCRRLFRVLHAYTSSCLGLRCQGGYYLSHVYLAIIAHMAKVFIYGQGIADLVVTLRMSISFVVGNKATTRSALRSAKY